jgi:hypothetical protein
MKGAENFVFLQPEFNQLIDMTTKTTKRKYEKPAMQAYKLTESARLLQASKDDYKSEPLW